MARLLAAAAPRRSLLGGLAGALAAASVGHPTSARPVSAACRKVGQKCSPDLRCCYGAECRGGRCRCVPGRTNCGGRCFRLDRDERHCGACDTACPADKICRSGLCLRPQEVRVLEHETPNGGDVEDDDIPNQAADPG